MKKYIILILFIIFNIYNTYCNNLIKIYTKQNLDKSGSIVYAENKNEIPYTIYIELNNTDNIKTSITLPSSFVIPPNTKDYKLFKVSPKDPYVKYSFSYTYLFSPGDFKNVENDSSFIYTLPYEHGTKHLVSSGYNGPTHKNELYYSIDFEMDIGTKICAARSGIVIDVKEDSNKGGYGKEFEGEGNYITIYHEDGSHAIYAHLKKEGAIVDIGDRVKQGDVIGYSGNTGYSSGPHLHFAVMVPTKNGIATTIPVKFLNYDGNTISLSEGKSYYSTHPDKPEFDINKDKIKNENYDDYIKNIPVNNKIEFRNEKFNKTSIVIFAANGFDEEKTITVDFTLKNLIPSKKLPVTINIPKRTELFLIILDLEKENESWEYRIKYLID